MPKYFVNKKKYLSFRIVCFILPMPRFSHLQVKENFDYLQKFLILVLKMIGGLRISVNLSISVTLSISAKPSPLEDPQESIAAFVLLYLRSTLASNAYIRNHGRKSWLRSLTSISVSCEELKLPSVDQMAPRTGRTVSSRNNHLYEGISINNLVCSWVLSMFCTLPRSALAVLCSPCLSNTQTRAFMISDESEFGQCAERLEYRIGDAFRL